MKFLGIFIFIFIAFLYHSFPLRVTALDPKLEDPHFWIGKIINPDHLLMTPAEIREMNEANLKRPELLLVDLNRFKEVWTREEILTFLKQDWDLFGRSSGARYGGGGRPLDDPFWETLKRNIEHPGLKEVNRLQFGSTVRRANIRVFPTEELSLDSRSNQEFDLFQHSAIAPASPVGIYYFSRDHLWAYVQTSFIRGWVRMKDLAIAQDKNRIFLQANLKEPLVVTGNFVTVFADPLFRKPLFDAQMGTSFPILHLPAPSPPMGEGRGEEDHPFKTIGKPSETGNSYVIEVPLRETDGSMTSGKGYIPGRADVHVGFLPYTQKNLAHQAFKMLHEPYGWGEKNGGRDCSRFIMDLFNSFGILMPRNSNLQAMMGISSGKAEGKSSEEKKKLLDRAVPLATLLYMPGHIMLYFGKHEGKYYAIHSIWGVQTGKKGSGFKKIGKVAVTDLDLGQEGPSGSLLQRLTEIQFIGLDPGVKN